MRDYFKTFIEKKAQKFNKRFRSNLLFSERILRSHFNRLKSSLIKKTKKIIIFIGADWEDFKSKEFYNFYKDIIENIDSQDIDVYFCINNQKFYYTTFSDIYVPFQYKKLISLWQRRPDYSQSTNNDYAYLLYLLQLVDSIIYNPFSINNFIRSLKVNKIYFSYIPLEDLFVRHLIENKLFFVIDNIIIHICMPPLLYNKLFLSRKAEKHSVLKGVKPLIYVLYKYKLRVATYSLLEIKKNTGLLENYFNRFIKLLLICVRKENYWDNVSSFDYFVRQYVRLVKVYHANTNELYYHMRDFFGGNFNEKDRLFIRFLCKNLQIKYNIGVIPKELLPSPTYPQLPQSIKLFETSEGVAQSLKILKNMRRLFRYHFISLKLLRNQIQFFIEEVEEIDKQEEYEVIKRKQEQEEKQEYQEAIKKLELRDNLYNETLVLINDFKYNVSERFSIFETEEIIDLMIEEDAFTCEFTGFEYYYIIKYAHYKKELKQIEKEYFQKAVVQPYYKKNSLPESKDIQRQAKLIDDYNNNVVKPSLELKRKNFESYYKELLSLLKVEITLNIRGDYIKELFENEIEYLYNLCYLYHQGKHLIRLALNNVSKEELNIYYETNIALISVKSSLKQKIQVIYNMPISDKYLFLKEIEENFMSTYAIYKNRLLFIQFISDIILHDKTIDLYTIVQNKEESDRNIENFKITTPYPLLITDKYYNDRKE